LRRSFQIDEQLELASPHYSWFLEIVCGTSIRLLSAFNPIVKC
jgi:hypothetical protein